MKTIVFGGAFDPVHSEHISLAAAAVKELGAEKLVLVPTFSPGHKSNAEASFSDRVEMLKLAFSDFPVQTEISDVERISGKTNYTFEILPLIEKKYGEAFYLVGGDSLEHFSTWRHPEKILELTTLVADQREGFENSEKSAAEIFERYGKKVILLDHVGKRISSGEKYTTFTIPISSDSLFTGRLSIFIFFAPLFSITISMTCVRYFFAISALIYARSALNEISSFSRLVRGDLPSPNR